ncbi:ABC transporter substrate-binding protein [Streptomyces sp. NPDC059063]|uniref:ABC transporter substrate-binding protein n=1 Tax=unclassified Streptomyces TaxID=2593676 RepID=UPI0036A0BE92
MAVFRPPASPTRRSLLTAGGAAALAAALAACGGGDDDGDGEAAGGSGGAWRFEDDRGRTAKARATPKRIVAYVASAAALHDFGVECVGVFGPATYRDGRPTPQAGALDVKKLTTVGGASFGDFNIEKYAALRPDLLVSNMNQPGLLWQVPDDSADKIYRLAPSVGIRTAHVSLVRTIQRYGELAAALGADLGADRVVSAKSRFERAAERLRRAAHAKKGIRVVAVATQPAALSVGAPGAFPDTRYFAELGVEFVKPRKPGKPGFWSPVSWENVDAYAADVIFADRRSNNMPLDEVARSKPTWGTLPAVKAGQVVPWNNEAQFSYAGYAPLIERFAQALENAKKVT